MYTITIYSYMSVVQEGNYNTIRPWKDLGRWGHGGFVVIRCMIRWNFDETVNDLEHHFSCNCTVVLKASLHAVSPSPDQKSFLSHLPIVSSYCAQYRQCDTVLFQAVRLACPVSWSALVKVRWRIFQLTFDKSFVDFFVYFKCFLIFGVSC